MNVYAYADLYADRATIATLLTNIKNIENKAQASVTVPDIQVGYQIGDRFKFQGKLIFFLQIFFADPLFMILKIEPPLFQVMQP